MGHAREDGFWLDADAQFWVMPGVNQHGRSRFATYRGIKRQCHAVFLHHIDGCDRVFREALERGGVWEHVAHGGARNEG